MTLRDLISIYIPEREQDYYICDLYGHYEWLSKGAILANESLANQTVDSFSFGASRGYMFITLAKELY